jgi:hypothetical protein
LFAYSESRCSFYGRKEVLDWLISQSQLHGYSHSVEEYSRLAINVARNVDHNGPELVKTVLTAINGQIALCTKDSEGITLLHRIASQLGGGYAYEFRRYERFTKFLDEGFRISDNNTNKDLLSRSG